MVKVCRPDGISFGCCGLFHYRGNAPIVEGPTSTSVYTVKPGDTLYSIARRYSLDPIVVARENNITNPGQLTIGQRLHLNIASGSAGSIRQVDTTPRTQTTAPTVKPAETPKSVPTTAAAPRGVSTSGSGKFIWPANGSIVQGFGDVNKGVDIAGKEGDPIVAAADGQVLFVGNVRGYGDLVIIKHDPTFVTAYGNNKTIVVRQGAMVKKGEKIATMGMSDSKGPRVHFEIRRNGKPIDPTGMLGS